jgi:tRNA(fMet)-specific endonuclease VapC
MKFMLDTNMCIHLIKHRPQRLLDRFDRTPVGDIGISSVTLAELEYGVAKSSRMERNREALRKFVTPLEIASFDRSAAAVYGKVRALLESKGKPIGSMDMLIAAHALSLGARVVTNNEAEFKRVSGLKVDNWL